jgi:hypothetical protein
MHPPQPRAAQAALIISRARAFGVMSAMGVAVAGPLIGGLITTAIS